MPQAKVRCTYKDTETTEERRGIDNGWTLLSTTEQNLRNFLYGDGTGPHTVVFLRYEFKGGLRRVMGARPGVDKIRDDPTLYTVLGHDVFKTYRKLQNLKGKDVHVWQRDEHGEIAVDFCVF